MHEKYEPQGIEARWQEAWARDRVFNVDEDPAKREKAFYALTMFPYPSGDRLHMGHMRVYTITDAIARWKRMQGHHVLMPMGWDAFGLPAENAAIKRGIHPAKWTWENIDYIREHQMKRMGFSYDWDREIATCSPDYYRWNQWFFLKLYEHGLAYRKNGNVNWCPSCATVLANEQVEDGLCWRCESVVEKKALEQWFFKITDYAEELLQGLDTMEGWPDKVRAIQRNWIGKSTGAELAFKVKGQQAEIRVFTTRPDTTCGVSSIVLAPEHPLVAKLSAPELQAEVEAFVARIRAKTELERTSTEVEKEGLAIGATAINPFTGEDVPIWIASYVLFEYGTGAVMGVPAHDERDYAFAKKYDLPIRVVIQPPPGKTPPDDDAYTEHGVMVNSGRWGGMPSEEAKQAMIAHAENEGFGTAKTTFRIRDWLISRQRYWGTPIPFVHCTKCGVVQLPEDQLPLELPENVQFTGQGKSPLLTAPDWINTNCPTCNGPATRETDTMDGFMCSSWYQMRYVDPKNDRAPFDLNKAAYWLPVDLYVGGVEHAIMHLLYFRFFNRFCFKQGWVPSPEPTDRLFTQGTVRYKGMRMSKSKGNVVSPNDLADEFGCDTARVFMLFAAPPESDLDWIDSGVEGSFRFLNRVWRQIYDARKFLMHTGAEMHGMVDGHRHILEPADREMRRQAHFAVKKVTDDLEREFAFNTAIAHIMVLSNGLGDYLREHKHDLGVLRDAAEKLVLLLAPFAPHIAEELWRELGHQDFVARAPWPSYDQEALKTDEVELAVQVNGKLRSHIRVPAEADQQKVEAMALADAQTRQHVEGKALIRVIVVPGRLVNIVVK